MSYPRLTSTDGCGEREESGDTFAKARQRLANRAGVERSQTRTSGNQGYDAGMKEALMDFAQK